METKKYYAEDMPAAMEQIKRELGADAIIIKSRKIKRKCGPLGLFHKSLYEVVVSCEPEQPPLRRREPAREPAGPFSQRFAPAAIPASKASLEQEPALLVRPERFAQLVHRSGASLVDYEDEDMLRILSAGQAAEQPAAITPAAKLEAYGAAGGQPGPPRAVVAPFGPANPPAASAGGAGPAPAGETMPAAPVKRGRGRPRKYPAAESFHAAPPSSAEAETLARLTSLERMIQEIRRQLEQQPPRRADKKPAELQGGPGRELDMDALLSRLHEQDVDQTALHALAADARERLYEGVSHYQALSWALEQMLGKPRYIRGSKSKPRCILFIGPTGVGKTTTLVKLVSSCIFERGAKVGIINADVFRVGAQDQLGAYARILNVPITTIYDSREIMEAISAFSELDFIFIDTSGKAPQDEAYQAELARLVSLGDIQEIYLTVSSATSGRVCRQIVKEYQDIGPYRVVVTKLDESGSYGSAVNLCQASGQPLSYITTGQNVPEDIHRAKVDEIIASLLR